mmetsp:Transcript_9473/g.13859  ORF Transcript_9473/g.13859 Transcript_9473/m.13859 type:complete len:81 (+) Transcript_9473:635-877(+)
MISSSERSNRLRTKLGACESVTTEHWDYIATHAYLNNSEIGSLQASSGFKDPRSSSVSSITLGSFSRKTSNVSFSFDDGS